MYRGNTLVTTCLLILVLGFGFEFLFEPFEVTPAEHRFQYWQICLIHAGSAAAIFGFSFGIIGFFVSEDEWQIYKEMIAISVVLLLIGVGSYLWRDFIYDNPYNSSTHYLLEEVRNTYLIGFVLLFIILVINFNYLNKRNIQQAQMLRLPSIYFKSPSEEIRIVSSVKSDEFNINPSIIICLKSDGNYTEFFIEIDGKMTRKITRLTFQDALGQLKKYHFIIKTHRAFAVNKQKIIDFEGNAQGYQLTLESLEFKVPVSRSQVQAFHNAIAQN